MKIQDLLRKDVMLLDLQATEKTAAIEEMIKSLVDHGYVTDFETFKEGILAREALTSTGLGDGIAMPHSKNSAVKEATVLFAKSNKGVDYESLDGKPTDLFFMIAAPEGANDTHLAAFGFMLPVLAGYIAYSIAEKPGLVSGFVAGAIASSGASFGGVAYAAGGEKTLSLVGVSSGFLGALVGGFLAGGVILVLRKLLAGLPRSLEGIRSILLLPLLGVLVTGFLMLAVNIPMSAINTALNDFLASLSGSSAVLLGLLVGGMMAVDMGGPVNKAAYVFGTSTLASTVSTGGSPVMAAVMAAGMVPPLAVFVATLFFKNKFTEEERNSGITNIVMGLSFITEGAIPFGAADPARAIPSFIVGSALTGALVGLSGIKLMAPHGGIFVIGLTNNPILYLVYVLIGAVVSGIIFGFLRKPLSK